MISSKKEAQPKTELSQQELEAKETTLELFKIELDMREKSIKTQEFLLNEQDEESLKRVNAVQQIEEELNTQRAAQLKQQSVLRAKDVELEKRALEIQAELPSYFEEKFKNVREKLNQSQETLNKQNDELEQEKQMLLKQKIEIDKAQTDLDNGFAVKKAKQAQDLVDEHDKKINALFTDSKGVLVKHQKEAENQRQKLHEEFVKEQSENASKLEKQRTESLVDIHQSRQNIITEIEEARELYKKDREELSKKQVLVETKQRELEFNEHLLSNKKEKFEQQEIGLEQLVEVKVEARLKSFEADEKRLEEECDRLRSNISASNHELNLYKELKQNLDGVAPEQVLKDFATHKEEIQILREELLKRPEQEVQSAYQQLRQDKEHLDTLYMDKLEEVSNLEGAMRELEARNFDFTNLEETIKDLTVRNEASERRCNDLRVELERLSPSTQTEQRREERLDQVQLPLISLTDKQKNELTSYKKQDINRTEKDWLQNIYEQCSEYGLTFNPRILFAFHTALKTAEWSPITILAGVSGTGKSELPRLYSRFGGINFLNLPVQPNWDSQESMLGFFNSIDNCFDAQPVLRLLAQSQMECTEDYPGLKQGVNIVLLDEMNLAHVELYFADFLSKLEQRRGSKRSELPSLEIKLGSGIAPYQLPIGRNVLWAGTMNQDETTKALSDKVLDRGVAIHFPRPKSLHSRAFNILPPQSPLLNIKEWGTWVNVTDFLPTAFLTPYKEIIEKLNEQMSSVGRALGHRVWQSVEYYMINYPMVMELMKDLDLDSKNPGDPETTKLEKWLKLAFEDQLVQKVMPKLRGIETRGLGKTSCLDPIRQLLDDEGFGIIEDFDRACKFGYGQFIWSSAEYLNNTELFDEFIGVSENTNDESEAISDESEKEQG